MFIRIFRPRDQCEVLINVDHISVIEVEYALDGDDAYYKTSLKAGSDDPSTLRFYRFEVAREQFLIQSTPGDPVAGVLEAIYKNAIKA